MKTLEEYEEYEKQVRGEFDRLRGNMPYGVCYQIPLKTLRGLMPESAREYYANWRKTDVVSVEDATNLHRP